MNFPTVEAAWDALAEAKEACRGIPADAPIADWQAARQHLQDVAQAVAAMRGLA